jgi:MoaA/NifB/PqqE/SkfB family radical SAM enzyme
MSRDEFLLVLDKVKGYTNFIYYHLMGEPLCHPELPDFIKLAGERGFKSIITTNGTLLNKRGDALVEAGIHKVNISVHSFEDGTKEQFDGYLKNIADFAEKANEKGVIIVFRLWNNGFDNGRNIEIVNYLKNCFNTDLTENTKGLKIKDKMFIEFGERFDWPDSEAEIQGDKFYCYGLKDQFGILCDGTIVPCCLDSDGVINLGNIFYDDIDSILNSERALYMVEGFKRGVATEDLCKRCGYAQRFV